MIRGLLGRKVGMTQIFDKEGNIIPVSVIEAGPCAVLEVKEAPKKKVKIGFEDIKETKLTKAQAGFFKKINVSPKKNIKEFFSTDNTAYQVGQELKADVFNPGDFVDVTGTSIGKGFAGGMKRWNWRGGPATHGSMHHRRVGSVGSGTTPGRVYPGRTMPGHMGARTITVQGLRVIDVDLENNLILVRGAVPGYKDGIVEVNRSQKRAFKSLDEKKAVVAHKKNPMKQSKAAVKGKG